MLIMISMARSAAEGGREAPCRRPARSALIFVFHARPRCEAATRRERERPDSAGMHTGQGTHGWVPELWVHRSCMQHCVEIHISFLDILNIMKNNKIMEIYVYKNPRKLLFVHD